jgi:uncharacterized surface anchored protein
MLSEKVRLRPLLVAIAFLTFVNLGMAQTSRVAGSVQGSVVDQTDRAVASATVTLKDQNTNQTRTTTTEADGTFHTSGLAVGQYTLRVESPGFSAYVNNAIVISVGRAIQVSVMLSPAAVHQQITVTESP